MAPRPKAPSLDPQASIPKSPDPHGPNGPYPKRVTHNVEGGGTTYPPKITVIWAPKKHHLNDLNGLKQNYT